MDSAANTHARLARWLSPLGPNLPPLYLVGGAVRDLLLNRPVKDIDVMTADPLNLGLILSRHHGAALVSWELGRGRPLKGRSPNYVFEFYCKTL
jgi:tRNA nucleotidyltransferase/poly(A) polymerase